MDEIRRLEDWQRSAESHTYGLYPDCVSLSDELISVHVFRFPDAYRRTSSTRLNVVNVVLGTDDNPAELLEAVRVALDEYDRRYGKREG